MSASRGLPHNGWAEPPGARAPRRGAPRVLSRVVALCLVELQKVRRDRSELVIRAVQPALWLLVFGETFTRIRAIPTGSTPYLDFLAPGILAQSGLFVSIFYGIQVIWDRDAGVLTKLMVTPTRRAALVTGKAFAAGLRSVIQGTTVVVLAALLGVGLTFDPARLAGVVLALLLGSTCFCCLSISVAGLVLKRDRMLGIGQAFMMPLFFASNALYPIAIMPGWLRVLNRVNPLSYEVEALRGLLIGAHARLLLDFEVLTGSATAGILVASALLGRLAR
ncbi:MAG TPA: ABC transporter permease [Rugosimonospora sp.]|nr:ABC transporter permease [Rugosimonospora sp.]